MKYYITALFTLILGCMVWCATAQTKIPYKIVFDITSPNPANQQQVIREMKGIKSWRPDAQLELVLYGGSLDMVKKATSSFAEEIKELASKEGISFKVCHHSMQRNQLKKSDLVAGVEVVPDGIYEILIRQKEGWGYIKVAQ